MISPERLALVMLPVSIEVFGKDGRAEKKDGLGASCRPSSAPDAEAPPNEVAAGGLNDARGDGQAMCECRAIAHVGSQLEDVLRAVVDGGPSLEGAQRGRASDAGGHLRRVGAGEEASHTLDDPAASVVGAGGMEAIGGGPEIFDEMNEVDDDGHRDAATSRRALHCLKLLVASVEQHDPPPLALRIAGKRLSKAFVNDARSNLRDAAEDALVDGPWPAWPGLARAGLREALELPYAIVGGPEERSYLVDGAQLRHAFSIRNPSASGVLMPGSGRVACAASRVGIG